MPQVVQDANRADHLLERVCVEDAAVEDEIEEGSEVTEYDLPKIREACLLLEGWEKLHDDQGWYWKTPTFRFRLSENDRHLPDPARSLGDAMSLMVLYGMNLDYGSLRTGWSAQDEDRDFTVEAETAALTVCLCALRCAGRDLAEFKVAK